MNSKLLHFLCVLACAALIGLGPLRAQKTANSGNGSAITAPAQNSDAHPSTTADSASSANAAVANDRDTVAPARKSTSGIDGGWIGLIGLFGLLGLIRRGHSRRSQADDPSEAVTVAREERREDYPRAA